MAYHGDPEESLLTLSGIGEQQKDGRGEFPFREGHLTGSGEKDSPGGRHSCKAGLGW